MVSAQAGQGTGRHEREGGAVERTQTEYALKNAPRRSYTIQAEASGDSSKGVTVKAVVTSPEQTTYRVEVVLEKGFTASKPHFSLHDFLLTGVELVKSHIESHRTVDFEIRLTENSGLPRSSPLPA